MLRIMLRANLKGWPLFRERRADKAFQPARAQILQRDQFTCQYCGFQARKYQQIVNIDGDYHNNAHSNLVTACVLCAQCQFLGCGNFGTMVYLPEYGQEELNQLTRVLFCAMGEGSPYQETARTLYRSFRNRAQQVDQFFGEHASDSQVFGQAFIDAGLQDDALETQQVYQYLRLLPLRTPLLKPIDYWRTLLAEHLA